MSTEPPLFHVWRADQPEDTAVPIRACDHADAAEQWADDVDAYLYADPPIVSVRCMEKNPSPWLAGPEVRRYRITPEVVTTYSAQRLDGQDDVGPVVLVKGATAA